MPSPTDDETEAPFPQLDHASTFSSHLSPDDAFISPPRRGYAGDSAAESTRTRLRRLNTEPAGGRRRKKAWKKLMWVKQSYPDNYTDQATFLENLQRNPRLKPYDFWPLVADSTVILQHVCSVIIFIACFSCIFQQERISPVGVVSWTSFATFLGWLVWERWVSEEDREDELNSSVATLVGRSGSLSRRRNRAASIRRPTPLRVESTLSPTAPSAPPSKTPSHETSAASSTTNLLAGEKIQQQTLQIPQRPPMVPRVTIQPSPDGSEPPQLQAFVPAEENRTHQRLGTIKSAILIYSTLLGLSPILKSLTRSTSSDSIWAMSFWLLAVNIFFFDYSGGVGAKFPASLSTNAALMASTVLASRLPSTKQVFSLTLFSIEVFGLFPVFRRHIRHRNWQYHVSLTISLVLAAGFGVGMVLGNWKVGTPWRSGVVGMVVGVLMSVLVTGGCSWWLIGLQKYKNEIRGPWDPARPIIMNRRRWEDR